jgi:adenylate kinase family enzyme
VIRTDDTEEKVKTRLVEFYKEIDAIVESFHENVISVDCSGKTVDENKKNVLEMMEKFFNK